MLKYAEHIAPYLRLHGSVPSSADLLGDGSLMLHPFYNDMKRQEDELDAVFGDVQPDFMKLNRPKESDAHKKYREAIFKNTVKPMLGRVTRQYQQINVVEDFEIEWPKSENEVKERSLQKLCMTKMFSGDTLEDFFWSKWANYFLLRPNGGAVLLPVPTPTETQTPTFKAMWVGSQNIWQHRKGEFAVIKSEEKSIVLDTYRQVLLEGVILYFFDKESYCVAKQVRYNSSTTVYEWEVSGLTNGVNEMGENVTVFLPPLHNCGGIPLALAGNTVSKVYEGGRYEMLSSILEDAVPHLKKALQRDEDGEIVALHHSVPREWEYNLKSCPTCSGSGSETNYDDEGIADGFKTCTTCKGSGVKDVRNGLGTYVLSAPSVEGYDDQMRVVSLPTPPMGRIDGDTAALEAFQKAYEAQVALAYRALGMEHLNHIPVAQAGIAKRYDAREGEMNLVTAGSWAGTGLGWLIHCTGALVWGVSGGVAEQEPNIRTPKRFSIEGADEIGQRLSEAIKNGYSAETIYTLQLKYLEVVASKNSDEYRMYQLRKRIDPYWNWDFEALNFEQTQVFQFFDRSSEEFQRQNGLIQLSKNFEMLVQDAIAENPNFWNMKTAEQRTMLMEANAQYFKMRIDNFEIPPTNMQSTVNVQDTKQLTQPN